jgi:hypothetical protein
LILFSARGYPKFDCGCYEGCDDHDINGRKFSFCCEDWLEFSAKNCRWDTLRELQLVEVNEHVQFKSSMKKFVQSIINQIEIDSAIPEKSQRQSRSLARTLVSVNDKKIQPCGFTGKEIPTVKHLYN